MMIAERHPEHVIYFCLDQFCTKKSFSLLVVWLLIALHFYFHTFHIRRVRNPLSRLFPAGGAGAGRCLIEQDRIQEKASSKSSYTGI